ncbi:hypothetical protein BCD67_20625 [Oscillatoriales cyanobacterium USR001]|nr:hypothetical protein BCD67_20625 [Oscillatoriales cyanobacterium USR001]
MKRIFLVGAPRSGTTILQSLLAAHPSIISFPETKFFQYLLSPSDNSLSVADGLKKFFVDKIKEPRFLSCFNNQQSELEKANALIAVLDTLAIEQNKSIWLEKTPQHIYYIDYLEKLLPEALFIHILRNGMDVITSMYEATRKNPGPDAWSGEWSIDFCIQRWQEAISISYQYADKNNHILVKYEQFVENPRLTLLNICQFAQIEFDDLMLSKYKETAKELSLGEPWHQGIERNIESSNSHKYYSIFKEKEIQYVVSKIRPLTEEIAQKKTVEITEEIVDIFAPLSVDRLICNVEMEGEYLGDVELPFGDGVVTSSVLADAIASKFYWSILHRFFVGKVGEHPIKIIDSWLKKQQFKKVWQDFLQDIWGQPYWHIENFYTPQLFEYTTTKHLDTKLLTIEVSEPLTNIEVALPEIDVMLTVGGAAIGIITIPVQENLISAQTLRVHLIIASGFELCRVCVREVLLGKPLNNSISLRSRLAVKYSRDTAMPYPHPSSVLHSRENCDKKSYFERRKQRQIYSGLSQFQAIEIANSNSSFIVRGNAQLPILRYRHISPELDGASVGYNITPDNFEKQLQYLSENNFYSAVWEDWEQTKRTANMLPGKPVLITFDGGYLDFFNYAWPLLKRYNFQATVFLVAARIGTTNSWERADIPEVPLLGWSEICQLRDEGVEFGSLGTTYQPLSLLSPTEIVQEALRSRLILEQKLGIPVKTFAYPYGDFDPIVQHLIKACGYTYGLSYLSGINTLKDSLLALRRIHLISSRLTNQDLQRKVRSKRQER